MASEIYENDLAPGGGGNYDGPLPPVANEDEEPGRDDSDETLGLLIMRLRKLGHAPLSAYLGADQAKAYRILNSLETPTAVQWYN